MNHNGNIEEKVEAALSSLDGMHRATANPFLYTRIMASLKSEEKGLWEQVVSFVNRPAIALAAVLVILLMNSLVFFDSGDNTSTTVTPEGDQVFAKEYNYPQTTADRFYSVNEEQ